MRILHALPCCALALLIASPTAEAGKRQGVTRSVVVAGPTLIAYMPPALRVPVHDGDEEAVAHLQFAVEDTVACAAPKSFAVVYVYAETIQLQERSMTESLPVGTMGQGMGEILVEPGRKAQVVASEYGPSTLQELLPEAAARYWKATGCGK